MFLAPFQAWRSFLSIFLLPLNCQDIFELKLVPIFVLQSCYHMVEVMCRCLLLPAELARTFCRCTICKTNLGARRWKTCGHDTTRAHATTTTQFHKLNANGILCVIEHQICIKQFCLNTCIQATEGQHNNIKEPICI